MTGQLKWCQTCGQPVGGTGRCYCWGLLAAAFERFLGMDFDTAADRAAQMWDTEADKPWVWAAKYAETHDVPTYPPPAEAAR